MFRQKLVTLFILLLYGFLSYPVNSKVLPPNYNYPINSLDLFFPGNEITPIDTKYPNKDTAFKNKKIDVYKYVVSEKYYKFSVYIAVFEGKVVELFTRLPGYFSHDVFHQTLIDKFGKQTDYFKKENTAIYTWKNVNGLTITYAGSCTITCFPIYYNVRFSTPDKNIPKHDPILTLLSL